VAVQTDRQVSAQPVEELLVGAAQQVGDRRQSVLGAQGVAVAHVPQFVDRPAQLRRERRTQRGQRVELTVVGLAELIAYRYQVVAVDGGRSGRHGTRRALGGIVDVAGDTVLRRDVR